MKRTRWVAGILTVISLATGYSIKPIWSQVATVTRKWTAVGDDSLSTGPVALYQLKWQDGVPIPADQAGRDAWWAAANNVTGMPVPLAPGTTMSITVSKTGGWLGGHTYYWLIKSADEAGNVSDYSNPCVDVINLFDIIRPAPVRDLR